MVKEKSENIKEEIKTSNFDVKKLLSNYWAVATIVLAVLLIVVLVYNRSSGIGVNVAADKVISFVKEQGGEATLVSTGEENGLYKIVLSIQGSELPVYVTKNGKYLMPNVIPFDESSATDSGNTETTKDVPKSDKPTVQAFVFAYCPYGLQFEKALAPVYGLLKNKADINLVFIGAMHDSPSCSGTVCFEKTESLRQLCIQKNYGKDKLWAYLDKFNTDTKIGSCSGNATCLTPLIEPLMTLLGIDKAKINACIPKEGTDLYAADGAIAQSNGVSGSPTFAINGVQVSVGRTPEAIKTAICSAFTSVPAECSQNLSTGASSAGFGAGAGTSTGASC